MKTQPSPGPESRNRNRPARKPHRPVRTPSPRQLHLPGFTKTTQTTAHGGDHTVGKRKTARPFRAKQALHVVLRSTRARGPHSLLHPKHCEHVRRFTHALQQRCGVRVYRYANVGNHLHLLVRARSHREWKRFIRQLAGGIAMIVTGARKGDALARRWRQHRQQPHQQPRQSHQQRRTTRNSPAKAPPHGPPPAAHSPTGGRAFWDHLVYTRLVTWGRDFDHVAAYVCKNLWEGMGLPVRKILARGFRVLEMSEDGFLLVPVGASPEMLGALGHG